MGVFCEFFELIADLLVDPEAELVEALGHLLEHFVGLELQYEVDHVIHILFNFRLNDTCVALIELQQVAMRAQ